MADRPFTLRPGVVVALLVAVGTIAAWKGLIWYFRGEPRPPAWVEAGKPLRGGCAPTPQGTTTLDIQAEDTVDVCVFDAAAPAQLNLTLGANPLFCSRGRTRHSVRIHHWPVATEYVIENPRRAGRVRFEMTKTIDSTDVLHEGPTSPEPSISSGPR